MIRLLKNISVILVMVMPVYASIAQTIPISGPNTANVNETKGYSVNLGTLVAVWSNWVPTGGTVQSATHTTSSIVWTQALTNNKVQYFMEDFYGEFYLSSPFSVTVAVPAPATTFTVAQNCGSTTVQRNTNPESIYDWFWQTSSSGTSTSLGNGASVNLASNSTLYLRARTKNSPYRWSNSSQLAGSITVVTTPPAVPATATDSHVIQNGNATVQVSVSAVSGATGYNWYVQSSGGTAIAGQSTTSYSPTVSQTTSYYVESSIGNCTSVSRKAVTANVHPEPVISTTNNGIVSMGGQVTLSINNFSYDSYQWINNGSDIQGATASSYSTYTAGNYKVRVAKGSASVTPASLTTITVGPAGQNLNYIVSNTILKEGVTENDVDTLSVQSLSQSIQYFDGLGRPMQSVVTQGSPNKKDIVQPIEYDAFGRESKKYLPYVPNENSGWYKPNPLGTTTYEGSPHHQFFNSSNPLMAQDARPYAETIFEASPLNRPTKSYGPGQAWGPTGNDKFIEQRYQINVHGTGTSATEEKVIAWEINSSGMPVRYGAVAGYVETGGYFSSGQLYVNTTVDEHENQVREYTNKQGQVILKKVQAHASGTSNLNSTDYWALTYYVYDDFGNLRFVLPPELSKKIHQGDGTGYNPNTDDINNWAFLYKYDGRKRMKIKKVPGADSVYMVYDKRDRLVLTQDGNQRSTKHWLFTKYDALNRPVLTGIHTADSVLTHTKMQNRVNSYYANLSTNGGEWFETFTGNTSTVHGYTNESYPLESNQNNYLTVTYYDTYGFKNVLPDSARYSFITNELAGQKTQYFKRLIGQVTGTKVKALDGGTTGYTWLTTVNYFDDRYRVIQVVTDNYKNSIDQITNTYDFVGKVVSTKGTHKINDLQWTGLVGVQESAGKLVRSASGNSWDTSGAASVAAVPASTDGWFEFSVTATNKLLAAGFSLSNTNSNWTSIKYVFYINSNATFQVRENGNSTNLLGTAQAYSTGDRFRIERKGGQINYYKNGVLLLQRTAVSDALLADVAFQTTAGEIAGVRSSIGAPSQHAVTRWFAYDHAGRLLDTWHAVNEQDSILLARNEYNELGELVTKKLYAESGEDEFKQHVDYRYNIRGWLTRINDADINSVTDSGPRDFFGMNLLYHEEDENLDNTGAFNGNISAMKWSASMGVDQVKERGYVFGYDALNRLLSASHKEKQTMWAPSDSFHEDNLTYDLNGNIETLNRKGMDGSTMDILNYDYGTGATASNKLLSVTDTGDKTQGFKEITSAGNDYVYDANGNMVWDKNKGGTEALTNGSFDSGSADWTLTDTGSRLTFANGEVQVAAGTATAMLMQPSIVKGNPYAIVIEMERTAGTLTLHVGGTGANFTYTLSSTGTHVLSAMAGTSFNELRITAGTTFAGKIKSVSAKAVTVITYNHLNLPATVSRGGEKTLKYVYDATGRKLSQEVISNGIVEKQTDYAGEFIYENDTLQFINTEEGRIVKNDNGDFEYQYHLKDHLGNVRTTFTTKSETESATATLETSSENEEAAEFLYYDEAVKINAPLFDHTNEGTTFYSTRLIGSDSLQRYGLAKSLSVMPGDTLRISVYAKYIDPDEEANWTTALQNLVSSIQLGTAPPGTIVDGGLAGTTGGEVPLYAAALNTDKENESGEAPMAYLNYLVFDRNWNFIDGGFKRISTDAKENGTGVAHEKLEIVDTIKQAGYVYIYLGNESEEPVEVFFDDFNVEHSKSPVIQTDDYYPFGLTFNSYSRENSVPNKIKFQGQEHIDDLGLGWDSFKWRNHQPDIGRFFNVDPLAEKYVHNSPYAFSENKVVAHIELEGLESVSITIRQFKDDWGNDRFKSNDRPNSASVSFQINFGNGKVEGSHNSNVSGVTGNISNENGVYTITGSYSFKATEKGGTERPFNAEFSIEVIPDLENGNLSINTDVQSEFTQNQVETFVTDDFGFSFMTGAATQKKYDFLSIFSGTRDEKNEIDSNANFEVNVYGEGDTKVMTLKTINLNDSKGTKTRDQNKKEFGELSTIEDKSKK